MPPHFEKLQTFAGLLPYFLFTYIVTDNINFVPKFLMKTILSVLVASLLFGCGQSKTQLIDNLNSEKKLLKDSLTYAGGMEAYFTGKAKASLNNKGDSLQYNPFSDSAVVYKIKASRLEEKVAGINSSIDSLTKIK